ncbi:MAG TPA: NYN domain-containing protein [Acidimicrobiales bacterium]|nr:NYN domain-containing protein [Acidimicrobiales bacterium]
MPAPPSLRPYLGFAKLTPMTLAAVARCVEQDGEFRERVAAAVDEGEVGRAGWLWLVRPDGWEDELGAIEGEAAARAAEAAEARAERSALRKLAAAQAAIVRAETEARSRLAELDEARTDLTRERAARVAAEARVTELEDRLAALAADRAAVVRNLKDVEARLVDRSTELNATRARVRDLEAAARERPAGEAVSPGPGPGPALGPDADVPSPAGPDPAVVAAEVARAAAGAAALAGALEALARLVAGEDTSPGAGGNLGPGPGAVDGDGSDPQRVGAADGTATATDAGGRRRPVELPGGVFDDSVDAAAHLLRTPGAVLVVDGYNLTMEGWPELDVAEQRRRLVRGLSDLAHRTATHVEVVFDGADVEPLTVPSSSRQVVRVRFSDPGVEADDVVIDLVGRIPAATPVIVASSDRRVRDGVRRRGANVVHARQILALLGR